MQNRSLQACHVYVYDTVSWGHLFAIVNINHWTMASPGEGRDDLLRIQERRHDVAKHLKQHGG